MLGPGLAQIPIVLLRAITHHPQWCQRHDALQTRHEVSRVSPGPMGTPPFFKGASNVS